MNVLVCISNNNYSLKDTLNSFSFYKNLNVYCFYSDITKKEAESFVNDIQDNKNKIYLIKNIKDNKINTIIQSISLLPKELDRILYIGDNLICRDNIDSLYNDKFDNNYIIGVSNFDNEDINTDLLLLNVEKIREFLLKSNDINSILNNKVKKVDNTYNYQINKSQDFFINPKIVNYNGDILPWDDNYGDPNRGRHFCDYLKQIDKKKYKEKKEKILQNNKYKNTISIIIPCYNVSKYLLQCIKSVSTQSFEDIEMICINDGSTDNTLEILEDCKKYDCRIKLINQKNKGLSGARNIGLDTAQGEFIGFVDSDDYIEKDMYKILYNLINKYDTDMVICNYRMMLNGEEYPGFEQPNYLIDNREQYIIENILDNNIKNYVWTRLYRKNVFDNVRFPIGRNFEDVYISMDIANNINKVYVTSDKLYYYRLRDDSISRKLALPNIDDNVYGAYSRYLIIKKDYYHLMEYNVYSMFKWLYYTKVTYYNDYSFYDRYSDVIECALNDYYLYPFNNINEPELIEYIYGFINNYIDYRKNKDKEIYSPKVSIIITTYKRIEEFKKALTSAINQDYDNKEIIVIDDNNLNSIEHKKIADYLKDYPEVIYHSNNKNIGAALSRNKGVELSSGEFISFLDDDDILFPNKIRKEIMKYYSLKNKKVGLIYCEVQDIDDNGIYLDTYNRTYEGNCLFEHIIDFTATTSTWLCPKKVFKELGGFDNVKSQQDATFILKLLTAGYEVYRVPNVLMFFKNDKNDKNRITTINEKYIMQLDEYHDKCRKSFYLLNEEEQQKAEFYFLVRKYQLYCYQMQDYVKGKKILDSMYDKIMDYETYEYYKKLLEIFINIKDNNK